MGGFDYIMAGSCTAAVGAGVGKKSFHILTSVCSKGQEWYSRTPYQCGQQQAMGTGWWQQRPCTASGGCLTRQARHAGDV
jgi:hypothetical protein